MRRTGVVAVAVGLLLLGISAVGLMTRPELPPGARRPPVGPQERRLLTQPLDRRDGEADAAYFRRLTSSVHVRMAHYWEPRETTVDVTENWLMHLAGYVLSAYDDYEFADAERALHRGYGWCSQQALIVFDVLRRQGYRPRQLVLPRHVVVDVRDRGGRPFVLDPDFGVVMPMSAEDLVANPESARRAYAALDPRRTPLAGSTRRAVADRMVSSFADRVIGIRAERPTGSRAQEVEELTYVLKWLVPVLLVVAGGAVALRPRAG